MICEDIWSHFFAGLPDGWRVFTLAHLANPIRRQARIYKQDTANVIRFRTRRAAK